MLQLIKLEEYCRIRNIKATFVDNILIDPLPVIKANYRIRKEPHYICIAINKFGCKTIVESMFNNKIILIL